MSAREKTLRTKIAEAVEASLTAAGLSPTSPNWPALRYDQTERILAMRPDALYWAPAPADSTTYRSAVITAVPYEVRPPYDYPDPDNYPTATTYTVGPDTTGPTRYAGATTAGLFKDTEWVYAVTTYALQRAQTTTKKEPAIYLATTKSTIDTDARGSRPMLSLSTRAATYESTSPPADLNAPPWRPSRSWYWRYNVPAPVPPYYHLTHTRNICYVLTDEDRATTSPDANRIAITSAPRPMAGRGYNNCETVAIATDWEADLWELSPCILDKPRVIAWDLWGYNVAIDPDTGNARRIGPRLDYRTWNAHGPRIIYAGTQGDISIYSPTGQLLNTAHIYDPQATMTQVLKQAPGGWTLHVWNAYHPAATAIYWISLSGRLLATVHQATEPTIYAMWSRLIGVTDWGGAALTVRADGVPDVAISVADTMPTTTAELRTIYAPGVQLTGISFGLWGTVKADWQPRRWINTATGELRDYYQPAETEDSAVWIGEGLWWRRPGQTAIITYPDGRTKEVPGPAAGIRQYSTATCAKG